MWVRYGGCGKGRIMLCWGGGGISEEGAMRIK